MPEKFKVFEEVYTFRGFVEENIEILIELDKSSVELSKAPEGVRVFPAVGLIMEKCFLLHLGTLQRRIEKRGFNSIC